MPAAATSPDVSVDTTRVPSVPWLPPRSTSTSQLTSMAAAHGASGAWSEGEEPCLSPGWHAACSCVASTPARCVCDESTVAPPVTFVKPVAYTHTESE